MLYQKLLKKNNDKRTVTFALSVMVALALVVVPSKNVKASVIQGGQWDMDEGIGTTIKDKAGIYTGTFVGNTTWNENGVRGKAISLNGKGSVNLGLDDMKGDWTVGVWVNKSVGLYGDAVLLSSDSYDIKLEQWYGTKKVGFTIIGEQTFEFDYSAPVGQWVHLTFVGNENSTSLYVDGALNGTLPIRINAPLNKIGGSTVLGLATPGNMSGSIDELKVLNRALSAEEIALLPYGDIVNKNNLQEAINTANEAVNNAIVGEEIGQYPLASKNALIEAINKAQEVLANYNTTQPEIDAAITQLNSALTQFRNTVNLVLDKVKTFILKNVSSNSADFSWVEPDNSNVVGYILYKDGKQIATLPADAKSYTVTNLRANTIYGFKLSAKYINGKESKPMSINLRTSK